MSIEHRKGSLFDAPPGVILGHACNAKGVWGTGIAKQFKERFPDNYNEYAFYCMKKSWHPTNRVGTTLLLQVQKPNLEKWAGIACMITSNGYGKDVDSPEEILRATETCFVDLLRQMPLSASGVHMPKINSGLFNVSWEKTEAVLEKVLTVFPYVKIVVWSPA